MNAVMYVSSDNKFRLNEHVERIKDGSTLYECEADNIDELLEQINEIYDSVDQIRVLLPESDGRLEWEIGSAFPDKQIEYFPENFVRPLYEERLFEANLLDTAAGKALGAFLNGKGITNIPGQLISQNQSNEIAPLSTAIDTFCKTNKLYDRNGGLTPQSLAKVNQDKNINELMLNYIKTVENKYPNENWVNLNSKLGIGGLANTNGTEVAQKEDGGDLTVTSQAGKPAQQNASNPPTGNTITSIDMTTKTIEWPFMPPMKGCRKAVSDFITQFVVKAAETMQVTTDQINFVVAEGDGWEPSYVTTYRLLPGMTADLFKLKLMAMDKAPAGTLLSGNGKVAESSMGDYLDILINKGYQALREGKFNPEDKKNATTVEATVSGKPADSAKEDTSENPAPEGQAEEKDQQTANVNTSLSAEQVQKINTYFNALNGEITSLQNLSKQAVQLYSECQKGIDAKDPKLQERAQMYKQFKEKEKGYYQFASIVCSYILGQLDPKVEQELRNMTKQSFKEGQPIDFSGVGGFFKGLFHSIYLGNIGKMITDDFGAIIKDLRNSGFGLFIDGANALVGTAGKLMRNAANGIGKALDKANNKKGGNSEGEGGSETVQQQISINGYDAVYMSGKAEEFHKLLDWDGQPNFYKYEVEKKGDNNDEKKTDGNGQSGNNDKQQPEAGDKQPDNKQQQPANGEESEA